MNHCYAKRVGQAREQAVPSVFGRYETLFRIAAGGMAEVYAARVRGAAGFQKLVALKRMLPHLTDDDRFVTMFMDEGRLAANISSPNVVSTLDLGRADDGSLYLVMELVVGTTLSALLRNAAKTGSPVPIPVGVELIAQAAQGLHDAHEARTPFGAPLHIVHRDVSPQNILVGTDGRVRITDFGVARAIMRRTKTSTGEFKGKLSYFSPEQCADKELDQRSDIFSVGVVAWETLTTRRLFHAENPLAVLERVTRMPIPSASAVEPKVPKEIADVVAKALERDRDKRFDTASDFAAALREAAQKTVGPADRFKLSEIVRKNGGDSLDRIQAQLRNSLSGISDEDEEDYEDDTQTEISSGIIFRTEDGTPLDQAPPAPPATTSTPSSELETNRLRVDPSLARPEPYPSKPSRLPYIVAAAVAVLGLGIGVYIGVQSSDNGGEGTEIPTASANAEDPAPAEPLAQAPTANSTALTNTTEVAEPSTGDSEGESSAASAARGASSQSNRRRPRGAAARSSRPTSGETSPGPATPAEPTTPTSPTPQQPPASTTERTGGPSRGSDPTPDRAGRERRRPQANPTPPPAQPQPPPRRGGANDMLMGADDFDLEIRGRGN